MRKFELLSVLYWILGALHLAGALVLVIVGTLGGLGFIDPSDTFPERLQGGLASAVLGGAAGALGGAHVLVGTALRSLRPWARTAGLVLAVVDILCCCNAPLGTAFGIFALVVLLSDDVARLFPRPG